MTEIRKEDIVGIYFLQVTYDRIRKMTSEQRIKWKSARRGTFSHVERIALDWVEN